MGRPSEYTTKTADYICEQLAEGKSLRQICAEDGMPAVGTVFVWLKKYTTFQEQYIRAREIQGHVAAEDAVDGALTADDPQLGRLRYDALKWRASKLVPKVYGDKLTLDATVTKRAEDMTDDELAAIAAGRGVHAAQAEGDTD